MRIPDFFKSIRKKTTASTPEKEASALITPTNGGTPDTAPVPESGDLLEPALVSEPSVAAPSSGDSPVPSTDSEPGKEPEPAVPAMAPELGDLLEPALVSEPSVAAPSSGDSPVPSTDPEPGKEPEPTITAPAPSDSPTHSTDTEPGKEPEPAVTATVPELGDLLEPAVPATASELGDLLEPAPVPEPGKEQEPLGTPSAPEPGLGDLLEPPAIPKPERKPEPPVTDKDAKKPGKSFRRFFQVFKKKEKPPLEEYDFKKHGPLVGGDLPEGYTLIDQYWIDEGRSLVYIALNNKSNQMEYLLFEPVLSNFEYELLERLHEDLRDVLILTSDEIKKDKKIILLEKTMNLVKEYGLTLEIPTLFKIEYYLIRNFLGWSRIDPLMKDPHLEDVSCDGNRIPIFLYHRKYRNIKTNIAFETKVLNSLAITLAQRSGKHISTGSPMLDATLPEGSRLQLTLGTEVTTRGTSFTIRKFREEPYSPIELLEYGTFNADELAYFWLAIENNKSLLFIGGTASGKTTSLNAVSLFIPPIAKVVSIEDTREITLFHDNWIASVTRESLAEGGNAITMFDLLRAAMRQRPEFILVGEVRGVEAQTLFQAMNTGHTTFSTMHAGSVDAAIHRLESSPLNVPRNMIQALNIISVQGLIFRGTERVRRVQEIVEIAGVDPGTGNLRVNNVFVYDPIHDIFSFTGRSQIYSDISAKRGWTRDKLENEISIRKQLLDEMRKQGIIDYVSAASLFHSFAIEREKVFANITDLKKVL
ncbi:MAG: ATPase, T2SS/T4P/T4SS family [Methanoregula sp.]